MTTITKTDLRELHEVITKDYVQNSLTHEDLKTIVCASKELEAIRQWLSHQPDKRGLSEYLRKLDKQINETIQSNPDTSEPDNKQKLWGAETAVHKKEADQLPEVVFRNREQAAKEVVENSGTDHLGIKPYYFLTRFEKVDGDWMRVHKKPWEEVFEEKDPDYWE